MLYCETHRQYKHPKIFIFFLPFIFFLLFVRIFYGKSKQLVQEKNVYLININIFFINVLTMSIVWDFDKKQNVITAIRKWLFITYVFLNSIIQTKSRIKNVEANSPKTRYKVPTNNINRQNCAPICGSGSRIQAIAGLLILQRRMEC